MSVSGPSKRLAFLEKLVGDGSTDPLAHYGLAMEYRSLDRNDEALATFANLRRIAPDYLPMYLLCGGLHASVGDRDAAEEWLRTGLALAESKGDRKTAGEIDEALAAL